ncbi:MAG: hypothetical protein WCA19_08910 [Candidatus Acidiferrales bacterium]
MKSRLCIAVSVAALGAALFAPSVPAQGRHGMHAPAAAPRARSSFRLSAREGFDRPNQRRLLNDSAFLFPYLYADDEFDYAPIAPEAPPVQIVVPQPLQPPAPAASPVEPLVLENHNGQWVRVPTGSEMPAMPQSTKPDSAKAPAPNPGFVELPVAAPPLPALPPAVIVFRDGHTEEVAKYMIQGETLFTNADYWSTGSWTRKIPLSDVDIPASLKLNKERGTKFNLPSGPNEVMIRF